MKYVYPFCIALFISETPALAHEVLTHQNIGNAAVAYLQQALPTTRPILSNLPQELLWGAVHEDTDALPHTPDQSPAYVGRYYFHFYPRLNSFFPGYTASGSCRSDEWGLNDGPKCTLTCIAPNPSSVLPGFSARYFCNEALTPATNDHRWSQDLNADPSGAPSLMSIRGFGYIVHLLEDLGSPAHVRNDSHPCKFKFLYCDPFEIENDGSTVNLQVMLNLPTGTSAVIPTVGFTTPAQFFDALQTYVAQNYYSSRTTFAPGLPGPAVVLSYKQYLYGTCIPISNAVGTCEIVQGQPVRKIAHKGLAFWASCFNASACDNTKADIDTVIAREQFNELGPVIAQTVAAFVQFYAPALNVKIQGAGSVTSSSGTSGNGINCVTGTCSALFVQGSPITLTANSSVSTVTWGGSCASAGNSPTATVLLTQDTSCTATFTPAGLAGDVIRIGYNYPAFGVGYPFFNISTNPVTVSLGATTTPFNINAGVAGGPGTDFTVDFTARSLTVTVVRGGGNFCGCGSSFNGPVFTVASPQSFPAVTSVSSNIVGFSGGVTATGNTVGINFQGLNVLNGSPMKILLLRGDTLPVRASKHVGSGLKLCRRV